MPRRRIPLSFLFALAAAVVLPVSAQGLPQTPATAGLGNLSSSWLPGSGRSYLGLHVDRSNQHLACDRLALLCDDTDRSMKLYAGRMVGNFWGVELGYLDTERVARVGGLPGAQGLNLSLVGKAPLGRAVGIYGKFGTTVGRPSSSVVGASLAAPGFERGFGLSYGAGVSVSFTPRLSATLEFESNDFRFAGSAGDPVRSTSLGLQYRY